jgi:AcrR family transcriptional regulator
MSKDEVIAILVETFRRDGYDGASIATLSKATGLGKSSLYHYFPGGKVDMATQVLAAVQDWIERRMVATLTGGGTPRARLARTLDLISEFYDHGSKACVVGHLCASVDRRQFQRPLDRVLRTWMGAIGALLMEAGFSERVARERAEDAVIRIQGALVVSGGLADPTPFQRAIKRLGADVLADAPAGDRTRPLRSRRSTRRLA